jgi:AcrR family transcriptional regulator
MAVAFTTAERERITAILLDTGHRLFTTQGLRKTSLAELVAPAGIAPSSFYAFFAAKEALYLELMLRRAPVIAGDLTDALAQRPTRAALVAVMRTTVRLLDHDPLYRRLLTHPDELAAVSRRLGPDELRRVEPHLLHPLIRFIEHAQAAGDLVTAAPTAVVGALRTVGLLVLHRSDYGDTYHQVLDLTIQALADGLTTRPDPDPRRSAAR